MTDRAIRTKDLCDALRVRYPAEAWALCWEVGDATGFSTNRHADAIAMSLWPSRGLHLHGFELKASRSDWLKELRNPKKAEAIAKYCDYWWLVVADAAFVKDGELPDTWGLLAWQKNGLRTVKEAGRLQPQAITPSFLAALLRSAAKPAVSLDSELLRGEYTRGFREAKAEMEKSVAEVKQKLDEVLSEVREFEKASGISLHSWGGWQRHTAEQIGRVVREVLNGDHDKDFDDLQHIRRLAASIVARIDTSNVRPSSQADE